MSNKMTDRELLDAIWQQTKDNGKEIGNLRKSLDSFAQTLGIDVGTLKRAAKETKEALDGLRDLLNAFRRERDGVDKLMRGELDDHNARIGELEQRAGANGSP